MRKSLELLRKQLPGMWVVASLLVTILLAGGVSFLRAEKTKEDSRAIATSEKGEDVFKQLDSILRDESVEPQQRVSRALEVLGKARQAHRLHVPTSPTPAPSDDDIDRLPWLDEPDTDVWASPWPSDWNPWREIQAMRRRMDQLLRDTWQRLDQQSRSAKGFAWGFTPKGEFEQTDDAYVYRFDLPGVDKENIKVVVENGRLTIEGKRESRLDESGKGITRREVFVGQFRRDMTLPPDADAARAESKLERGVLTIRVPRIKNAAPSAKHTIQVQ